MNAPLGGERATGDFEFPDFFDVRLEGPQIQIGHLNLNVARSRERKHRAL